MSSAPLLFGVHFAWPVGFFLGILLPALIFAYLRKERTKKVIVSSLLLFNALPKRARARRKFKPPLQFFLELLALLALLFALSSPFRDSESTHLALLVDTSLSMSATDQRGQSRLNLALAQLAERLAKENNDTRITVFKSTPALTKLGVGMQSPSEIIPLVQTEGKGFAGDSLELDIEQLSRNSEYDKVLVLTDREVLQSNHSRPRNSRIEVLTTESRTTNLYIENLDFKNSQKSSIVAMIGASSETPMQAQFSLYGTTQVGAKERLLHEERIRVAPPNSLRVETAVTKANADIQFFRASIQAVPQNSDGLSADDQAWLASERASSTQLALIGYPSGSAGLQNLGAGAIATFSPSEYAALKPASISSYDVLIFYGMTPLQLPPRPSLFILPPEGSSLIPVRGTNNNVVISSWQSEHPLLRYLSVPLLKPQQSLLFDTPNWAQAVIRAEQGPIAIAGEREERKLLALGFELLPFEGRATPTSSILLLNSLQWLSGGAELTSSLQVGSTIRLTLDRTWIIRQPDTTLVTFAANAPRDEHFAFPSAGLFVVSSAVPGSKQTESRVYTVQGYIPSESATWQPPLLTIPESSPQAAPARSDSKEFWPYLTLCALVLLSLQALLTSSKWRRAWN